MENRTRRISGSLNSLEVLEAAVRLRSLSTAARELNISQPAVSHHVAILEQRLQQQLFIRRNNRIMPTANALKLADAIAISFSHVDQVWTELSAPIRADEVTIACSFGFADQWLMQRFSALRSHMGGIQVHVITTDRLRDVDMSSVDAAIVWNLEDAPQQPSFSLITEEVFPICSPEFFTEHHERLQNLASLPPENFLHFDVGQSDFLTWPGWFMRAGSRSPGLSGGIVFNTYPFLLQAVRNGEGIALGWKGAVDRSLAEKEIVRLGPTIASREVSYHVFYKSEPIASEGQTRLIEWLKSQIT